MEKALNDDHMKELNKFLNFFKNRNQQTFKEMDMDFNDFEKDNLNDDMSIFNKDEVIDLLKKFKNETFKHVEREMSNNSRMSGIYVRLFMLEAQENNFTFSANLNMVEDLKLIDLMKNIEKGEGVNMTLSTTGGQAENKMKKTSFLAKQMATSAISKLPSILGGEDPNSSKIQDLNKQIAELISKNNRLEIQISQANVQEYKDQVRDLKVNKSITDLKQQKMQDMEEEYKEIKGSIDKKVNESTQYNNLKKMIQTKNTAIKELQQKLSKYEDADD